MGIGQQQARRTNQAPPAYRPQIVPRVLQLKAAAGQRPQAGNPSRPPTHHPAAAALNRGVIQRAAESTGSSGRSAGELWDLFSSYSQARAKNVTDAFTKANYTINEMGGVIKRAIKELNLDLAAHGKGGTDSGTQGDYEETAKNFESKLIGWAAQHPKTSSTKGKSGLEHSEEEQKQFAAKKEKDKKNSKLEKHETYHKTLKAQGKSRCPECNKFI